MSIKRIFVNSYLAYINEPNESLTEFRADFPQAVNNPDELILINASLAFYPQYPNFSPSDNKIYINATSGGTDYAVVISLPTETVYDGASGGTNPVSTQLNNNANVSSTPALPSNFNTNIGTFTYSTTTEKFTFTPAGGVSAYTFIDGVNNAYRRLGLGRSQVGVAQTTGDTDFINSPFIAKTQVIYLASDLTNDSMSDGKGAYTNGIIAQIPITNPAYGAIITFDPHSDICRVENPRSFQSINFRVLDDNFQPLEFDTNANLALAFQVNYLSDKSTGEGIGSLKNPYLNPFQ